MSLKLIELAVRGAVQAVGCRIFRLWTELGRRGWVQNSSSESEHAGAKRALISRDVATCFDSRREIFHPRNRRFRYPFPDCTNCDPRFPIMEALPYGRANCFCGAVSARPT